MIINTLPSVLFCFLRPSLKKKALASLGLKYVDPCGLGFRDLPASAFLVLGSKVCTLHSEEQATLTRLQSH